MAKKHRTMNRKTSTGMTLWSKKTPLNSVVVAGNAAIVPLTTTSYVNVKKTPPCHDNPTLLFDQLLLGGSCGVEMAEEGADIIIILGGSLFDFPDAWKFWCGELYGIPINDYSILPDDVLEIKVNQVVGWLNEGKKVGMFCIGGHGRTGYFASCILGKWKPEVSDPIKYLRENYCKKVVESTTQIDQIAKFLGNEAIKDNEPSKTWELSTFDYSYFGWGKSSGTSAADSAKVFVREDYSKSLPPVTAYKGPNGERYCYQCGIEIKNKDNFYYCDECLTGIQSLNKSKKDDTIKDEIRRFCFYCGTSITSANKSDAFRDVCMECEPQAYLDIQEDTDEANNTYEDDEKVEECIYCYEPITFKNDSHNWKNVCRHCELIHNVKPVKEANEDGVSNL